MLSFVGIFLVLIVLRTLSGPAEYLVLAVLFVVAGVVNHYAVPLIKA